jgi:phosphate transport system substrate-binding protein
VFPLSQRVAEIFKDEGFKGQITIDSIGTGAGFERFCKGETDVSNASAKISAKQTEDCKAKNIEPLEFRVGTDALAIVMDNESPFLTELTLQQLADVFSGTYKTWDQLNPAYPKEKIQIFSPGTDSGTFDYFTEVVFKKDKKLLLNNNPQLSEDDNVLVRGVEGSKFAIGYFGYAYYNAENKRLKAIKINGIEPNRENVDNAKYPLARPLFLYSTQKILTEKPQVAAYVGFYLARVEDAFKRVAYFPAPEADASKSKEAWRTALSVK